MGRRRIVDALEHAEAAHVLAVLLVVKRIVADQDSAQRLLAADGNELRRVAMLIEGMLAASRKSLTSINSGGTQCGSSA